MALTTRSLKGSLRLPILFSFVLNLCLVLQQQREWNTQPKELQSSFIPVPVSLAATKTASSLHLGTYTAGVNKAHTQSSSNTQQIHHRALNHLTVLTNRFTRNATRLLFRSRHDAKQKTDAVPRNVILALPRNASLIHQKMYEDQLKRQELHIQSLRVQSTVRAQVLAARELSPTNKFTDVKLLGPSAGGQPFSCRDFDMHFCRDDSRRRKDFPAEIKSIIGEFTPVLTTTQNILVMGDSVGMQLSHLFQHQGGSVTKRVLKTYSDTTGAKEWISLTHTQGGGVIAGYRILGFLTRSGLSLRLPPLSSGGSGGGGWRYEDVARLKSQRFPLSQYTGLFDTLIFRIPQVWIGLHQVTFHNLRETVENAQALFNVSTVIFTNLPIINNYNETSKLIHLKTANEEIRSFVKHWQTNVTTVNKNKPKVSLLEIGTFINNIGFRNAQNIGYDISSRQFIFDRIPENRAFPRAAALNCAEPIVANQTCPINMLYKDGIHWCMETVGPRIIAGVACLQSCQTAECDEACNQQYMRLKPIQDSSPLVATMML